MNEQTAKEMFGEDFSYRQHQEEAVKFALKSFAEGKEVVVFEAPTGFGKSIANIIIAHEYPWVFYTAPQVLMVDQLGDDPMLENHVDAVYGKSHYHCIREGATVTVDIAPCEKGIKCPVCQGRAVLVKKCSECEGRGRVRFKCKFAKPVPECPYWKDKWNAAHGQVAITTLAYMLLVSTPSDTPLDKTWNLVHGRFPPRDLLVVDEAHGTADSASSFISLTLSQYTPRVEGWKETWKKIEPHALSVKNEQDVMEFLTKALIPELRKDMEELEAVEQETNEEGERTKILEDIERIGLLLKRVGMALEDMKMGNPWAIDPKKGCEGEEKEFKACKKCQHKYGSKGCRDRRKKYGLKEKRKLILQPVLIGPFLRRRLWDRAGHYLLSTATVLDPDLFLRELGLDDKEHVIMRIPSIFPPENAPIKDASARVGSLSRDYIKKNRPKALEALCRILDREQGRGLVHCHAYMNQKYIRENIPSRYRERLVYHDGTDREAALGEWKKKRIEGSVLVSVAMTDGLDLPGDLAEWAVIFKVPYPNLGDKRVAKRQRMKDGWDWYDLTTLRTIIQASGRIVRSENDKARVYILDGSIHNLLRKTSQWIPDWFKDRLRSGEFQGFL